MTNQAIKTQRFVWWHFIFWNITCICCWWRSEFMKNQLPSIICSIRYCVLYNRSPSSKSPFVFPLFCQGEILYYRVEYLTSRSRHTRSLSPSFSPGNHVRDSCASTLPNGCWGMIEIKRERGKVFRLFVKRSSCRTQPPLPRASFLRGDLDFRHGSSSDALSM